MEPGALDLQADVGPDPTQAHRPASPAQATRKHGQVDHQGDVRERELAHVDDDITLGTEGAGNRLSPSTLSGAILIASTPQNGGLFAVIDDRGNLHKCEGGLQQENVLMHVRAPNSAFRDRRTLNVEGPKLLNMVSVDDVTDALRDVIDPELGLDFVELGLIYDIEIEDATVKITYSLTTPACPIGPHVSEQIEEFVGELDGVQRVEPTMTFSPPWTPERMSEDAKFALGF
jgi:metal-sulfur cluster biosynthetic enzyme